MTHSPRLRGDDRTRIVDNATETLARIKAYEQGITTLRDAITARLEDGLRAASYDEAGGTGDGTSTTERAALRKNGDQAHDDLTCLDRWLVQLADAEHGIATLLARYPIWNQAMRDRDQPKPGKGFAPAGRCQDCWHHGRDEPTSDRYARLCDICGRWRHDHGERIAKPLWDLRVHQGKARVTTGDLRRHAPHLLPKDQAS